MKIKKLTAALVALMLLPSLMPAALAAGKSCSITTSGASAAEGDTLSISVSISDNPGYTNCGIVLDYDREKLELAGIEAPDGETVISAVNTSWTPTEGMGLDMQKKYGYVSIASADQISENGVLFTASFRVLAGAEGEAQITPLVRYIRDNTALFSVFENISAAVSPNVISIESQTAAPVLPGDLSGDGRVMPADAALVYAAFKGQRELTAAQILAADVNGDNRVTMSDAAMIYAYFKGLMDKFPVQ